MKSDLIIIKREFSMVHLEPKKIMEGSTTGSAGGGGPAPFLVKTYEMVDDSSTDELVSWSQTNNSFIVWNPAKFSSFLLRQYFKHNNFSSFIRQLNTYGFRKITHEQWEFANEYFVRGQRHLLSNIHRKKTIHSHSVGDPERLAYEAEIEKLTNEKASMESRISSFKQQMSARKFQVGNIQQRLDGIEQRQKNLLNLFQKVLKNPKAVAQIYEKIGSENLIGYNKKRRFPRVAGNSFADNDSSFGIMQAGNEDGENAHDKTMGEGEFPKERQTIATLGFVSDKEGSFFSDSPSDNSISEDEKGLSSEQKSEESDCDQTCCLLNLTLAPSPTHDRSSSPEIDCQELRDFVKSRLHANDKESDAGGAFSNRNLDDAVKNLASSPKSPSRSNNQEIAKADRVNNVFWSQYLIDEGEM